MRVEKLPLSESSKGAPVAMSATFSPGTLLHSVPDSANIQDTVHLWAFDSTGSLVNVYLELVDTIASVGTEPLQVYPIKVLDGAIMEGGTELRAYEPSGATLTYFFGYVLRIYKDEN